MCTSPLAVVLRLPANRHTRITTQEVKSAEIMRKPCLSLFGFFVVVVLVCKVLEGWMTNSMQLTRDTASEQSYLFLAIASHLRKIK